MKRSKFNLSHYKLATLDMGELVPVQLMEVLPGDTVQLATSALIRLTPQLAPVMHPVRVRIHHWFVPNRIIWDGWEEFITGGPNNDSTLQIPTFNNTGTINDLGDYFGLPPNFGVDVSDLPYRAYNRIWNEFYRDQDLQTERGELDTDVAKVNWGKDYFTTSRPWPQKGPDVTLPVAGQAPVKGIGKFNQGFNLSNQPVYESDGTNPTYANSVAIDIGNAVNQFNVREDPNNLGYPGIYADLSQAAQVTINEFREGFALQRYAEARAQYGSRYTEYLRYLGVNPSDGRLQRPEYLGGGKQTVSFSEVIQSAGDASTGDPVGSLKGHGIVALRTRRNRRFFEEHGHIVTLVSVVPVSIYSQGVHRSWLRKTKEDYFQKELQFIGQQEIYNNEVYADASAGTDTFGFGDRYSEYRSLPSNVSGEFRWTMDHWHFARRFASAPVLNSSFIECNPTKRVFAEQTQHSLWCMINNHTIARRMVSKSAMGSVR